MKFPNNKYTKWYYNIMTTARNRENHGDQYLERHHVLPKSLGGKNIDNIVALTPKEHYIAHMLLTKMVKSKKYKKSMCYSFFAMMRHSKKHNRYRPHANIYKIMKESIAQHMSGKNNYFYGKRFCGKQNPFYGRKHSNDTVEYLRAINTGRHVGTKNQFYGKKHTEATKKKLSLVKGTRIIVHFLNGKMNHFDSIDSLGLFLGKSKALAHKLLIPKYHYLWKNYNIINIKRIEI